MVSAAGPQDEDRQRPALSVLDVAMMSPVECYGTIVFLLGHPDPAVQRALSDAVSRVVTRTRAAVPPPA